MILCRTDGLFYSAWYCFIIDYAIQIYVGKWLMEGDGFKISYCNAVPSNFYQKYKHYSCTIATSLLKKNDEVTFTRLVIMHAQQNYPSKYALFFSTPMLTNCYLLMNWHFCPAK